MVEKFDYAEARMQFMVDYANVPLPLRTEIIGLVDDEPYSWKVAYLEVKNNSDKARGILENYLKIKNG